MDQQYQRGRSPYADDQSQPHISQSSSPAQIPFAPNEDPGGIGLDVDQQQQQQFNNANSNSFDPFGNTNYFTQQQQQQQYAQASLSDPTVFKFEPNTGFGQSSSAAGPDSTLSYDAQSQASYLSPNLNDGDFSLFPPSGGQGDLFNAPLFDQSTLNPNDINNMAAPQTHQSPPAPHLQPGSAHQSPSFNQLHFSSPPGGHSRNASLGPEAALLPNQMSEWTQPQFQGHRRTPSEYSDVSSVNHSPNLLNADSFDVDPSGSSPLQRASNGSLYQEVLDIGSFTIDEAQGSPDQHGRSPSHSPAISPRILPQQMPEVAQPGFGLAPPNAAYTSAGFPSVQGSEESFPTLQNNMGGDMTQMVPPAINIDFAPNNSKPNNMDQSKPPMDQDSLTPPDRGRPKSRPRAVTDPFHPGGALMSRSNSASNLSPSLSPHLSPRPGNSRSLSPLERHASGAGRRRQSFSAVPNNSMALRLVDPEYQGSEETGGSKRVQKHPATFQCTLCPKRFTRAYNLRSHLRTHTDERPFVCTVCGKAFARQHDRKRHEGLHSGEKKFVCKGALKAGGQWGCSRRFARADALGRHFRSEAGRICIKPLLDEEMMERQRLRNEQQMQQNMAQNMAGPPMGMDLNTGFPMDSNNIGLPAALLAQYPALAQMNWSAPTMSGGMDDDLSGRSSFEASDYDDGDDAGYMSGPGSGFGEGGMNQNFGDMQYASDYGGQ